jgi:hypothetical protein
MGEHQCFCNSCGDDLAIKSQSIAEEKFNLFKSDFERKQATTISGESHTVSDKYLSELQARLGSEISDLKSKLNIQKDLNSHLMDKIQRFKSQKYISEEHISNS